MMAVPVSIHDAASSPERATASRHEEIQMDVRSQQIVVQRRMNDHLAEARMARLAREVQDAGRGFEQELGALNLVEAHTERSGLVHLVERFVEAAAAAGHAISPRPPIRVAVRR
jgi:hypothetical protein